MNEALPLAELQGHFSMPGTVDFAAGEGNLPRVEIQTSHAAAHIYLHGAHLTHYQKRGEPPLLFMSRRSWFERDKPIRGGVPVIFPWFGRRRTPMHGIVRTMEWGVESVCQNPDESVSITFALASDDQTRPITPGEWDLRYTVTIGPALEMSLEVSNPGEQPLAFEAALHPYFMLGDVRQAHVEGLGNTEFLDATKDMQRDRQPEGPLQFTARTDRVYVNTSATCIIRDPLLKRRIIIDKHGSRTSVVWTPWSDGARGVPDLDQDEWPHILCVETANARENAINLTPGGKHVMGAIISIEAI